MTTDAMSEKQPMNTDATNHYECTKCGKPCDVRYYSRSRYFGTTPISSCCGAKAVVVTAEEE